VLLLAAAVAVPVYLGRASSENAGDATTTPSAGTGTDTTGGGSTGKSETDSLDLYHITVKVGRADKTLKTLKDVARLSPLPSVDDPFMVYTGVLDDGKTAVFLLSSDAKATGDGKCKPSATDCESVEVKEGDTEFFDLTVDGEAVQYELDVLEVKKTSGDDSSTTTSSGAGSAKASVASAERHSNAGAQLLRQAHVDGSKAYRNASAYRWVPARGVLVRTPKQGAAQVSVVGATAASSADAAATLPGQPVWHWQLGD
jgi:hypothetical protein